MSMVMFLFFNFMLYGQSLMKTFLIYFIFHSINNYTIKFYVIMFINWFIYFNGKNSTLGVSIFHFIIRENSNEIPRWYEDNDFTDRTMRLLFYKKYEIFNAYAMTFCYYIFTGILYTLYSIYLRPIYVFWNLNRLNCKYGSCILRSEYLEEFYIFQTMWDNNCCYYVYI